MVISQFILPMLVLIFVMNFRIGMVNFRLLKQVDGLVNMSRWEYVWMAVWAYAPIVNLLFPMYVEFNDAG